MLKKTSLGLWSCGNLQGVCCTTPPSATTLPSLPSRTRSSHQPLKKTPLRRTYAMVTSGHSKHQHQKIPWPEVSSSKGIPTPYQIFNQKKGSPYSKHRFYELVKLYHPDRHSTEEASADGLSYATKVERYRLVVAANTILSDPVKRGAYDCYGAGWNGHPDVKSPRDATDGKSAWGSYSGRGWAGGPDGPSQNATWEDWERWYKRDSKEPQEPNYFSNGAFVSLICLFAALGGVGQATWAGNRSTNLMEGSQTLHGELSRELNRRRRDTSHLSREEKIEAFLRQRDPFGYGAIGSQEEHCKRLLPQSEPCSSLDVDAGSTEAYHKKEDRNGRSS